MLPIVEWVFIFIPILYHALYGVAIVAGAVPNTTHYPYMANRRYNWQRWSGMIAFVFIFWHVFHMHGWFHSEWWLEHVAKPFGGYKFRPYNAASTAGLALQDITYIVFYAVGVLACVYHLANGIWTAGITWGIWVSDRAQSRALSVCGIFGILLAIAGLGALGGMWRVGHGEALEQAIEVENRLYESKINSGELTPMEHKRSAATEAVESKAGEGKAAESK
jgi:succinate dehydrogenase / fumarate reductase cytochrome b subunit